MVTVNDYLAQRDADWMGRIYRFLGLTVGVNLSQMSHDRKQAAYAADITYGTNNEFGFDYLRDNMVFTRRKSAARPDLAIVDEVDSILIDEARTPLIISGQADDNVELYYRLTSRSTSLSGRPRKTGHGRLLGRREGSTRYCCRKKATSTQRHSAQGGLLPAGSSLYDAHNISLMHHLYAALRAHALFHRDQHYVVQDGEVIIVDEFTGRLMPGRRWSDGLHQAVEAKEGVGSSARTRRWPRSPSRTISACTPSSPGMTGTADTEAFEFQQIYHLETVVIPDQPADDPQRRERSGLPDLPGKSRRDRRRHQGLLRAQPAGAGGNHVDRELGAAVEDPAEGKACRTRCSTPSSTRAKRKSSPRPVAQGDHDRHQHGRPRNRHRAGRQRSSRSSCGCAKTRNSRRRARRKIDAAARRLEGDPRPGHRCPAACTSWAPSATSRGASTTSLRGRAGRQGDPGSLAFLPVAGRSAAADLRRRAPGRIMQRLKMPEGEPIEHAIVNRRSPRPRTESSRATSTCASSCWNTTTWPTTSAA